MKLLYIDCFSGASGDKFLGSLIDAGLPLEDLQTELAKLNVEGFSLSTEKSIKLGITGTQLTVTTEEQNAHRHLSHIEKILNDSSLPKSVVDKALTIFGNLAKAEAKVHNTTPEKIHFHEVGALDAIVDIVGTVIGLELLKIDKIVCSPVATGTGFVECAHGTMPLPAPATIELLKGLPLSPTTIKSELTTPTGAAIIATLVDSFGPMPSMAVKAIGYGAGRRDLTIPNHLRIFIGELSTASIQTESADLIETNIDDMNPELFDHAVNCLRKAGAVDVFMTPIQMKKNRPAVMLSVLSPADATDRVIETLFRETTSIGLRLKQVTKKYLDREILTVKTDFGPIKLKICSLDDEIVNIAPEYEDCRAAATKHGKPIDEIYDIAKQQARITIDQKES